MTASWALPSAHPDCRSRGEGPQQALPSAPANHPGPREEGPAPPRYSLRMPLFTGWLSVETSKGPFRTKAADTPPGFWNTT